MSNTIKTVDFARGTFKGQLSLSMMSDKGLIEAVREKVRPIFTEVSQTIARKASQDAPMDSGKVHARHHKKHLRQSIKAGKSRKNLRTEIKTVTLGPKTGYGGYVEFGTKHARPTKFLYPAYESEIGNIMQKMRDIL